MTKHPRTHVAIPAAFTMAIGLFWAVAAPAYYGGIGKDAEKGNACLIGYNGIDAGDVTVDRNKQSVSCTDCDPNCDLDGVDTANGSCAFGIGVCINQSGVEGCTPPSALDKGSVKGKVKGVKGSAGKVEIDVSQLLDGSACSAFLPVVVPEDPKGKKGATIKISGSVKRDKAADTPKRKNKEKLTYICVPRPDGEDCPSNTTTSTTTTTSITTSTIKPCGNGTIDAGETCDPAAEPTGCAGGETCLSDCTCAASCAPPGVGEPATLTFTTGLGTTQCGSTGFSPTPAAPPFGGVLKDGSNATLQNLGLGCLYIGGGVSTVPGGVTPDSAPSNFAVDLVCDGGNTLALGGANTGDPKNCSVADGPSRSCANGNPGIGGTGACNTDSDCRPNCTDIICHDGGTNDGQPCVPGDTAFCAAGSCFGGCINGAPGTDGNGKCLSGQQCGSGAEGCVDPNPDPPDTCAGVDGLICIPTANCYFGPPLPVKNGPLSTCVQNVFDNDAFGTADVPTGSVTIGYTLSSRVHFTSTAYPNNPCPTCVAGVCDAGPNEGQPCTGVGVDATTHDCPPDGYFFLAPLSVTLDPLTTNSATQPLDGTPSADGLFCPFQGNAGAFTVPAARLVAMQGSPVSGGLDSTAKDGTLVSAFCIPRTGNVLIDGAANLPGPGATSLGGTLQLTAAP